MIIITFLRAVRETISEAFRLRREVMARYPYLMND
jgi:hypothetical protein